MYRNFMLSFSLLCTLLMAGPALAQSTIAVVSLQRIMKESTAMQGIREQMEAKRKSYQEIISQKEEELREEEQKLVEQRAVLSPEQLDERRLSFRKEVSEVQRDVQQKRSDLDRAYSQATNEVKQKVLEIIAGLAEERGFHVALTAEQIMYAEPSMDISPEVVSRLNAELPTVGVDIE